MTEIKIILGMMKQLIFERPEAFPDMELKAFFPHNHLDSSLRV